MMFRARFGPGGRACLSRSYFGRLFLLRGRKPSMMATSAGGRLLVGHAACSHEVSILFCGRASCRRLIFSLRKSRLRTAISARVTLPLQAPRRSFHSAAPISPDVKK
eukprot:scaffold12097_cov25-Prasinocladus_malaysianus.AAC.2